MIFFRTSNRLYGKWIAMCILKIYVEQTADQRMMESFIHDIEIMTT